MGDLAKRRVMPLGARRYPCVDLSEPDEQVVLTGPGIAGGVHFLDIVQRHP